MQYTIVQYSIAGANLRNVQYSIVRERAPEVCRGFTAVLLLQFLDLEQAEPPVARERVRARVRHGVVIVEQF